MLISKVRTDFRVAEFVIKSYWNCNVYVCYQRVSWRQGLDLGDIWDLVVRSVGLQNMFGFNANVEGTDRFQGSRFCNEIMLKW